MSYLNSKAFWKNAAERAVWTFAQTVTSIVAIYVPTISIATTGDLQAAVIFIASTIPWVIAAGLGAAALSVLKETVKAGRKE